MKTAVYMRQETQITSVDQKGIAQRRLWGLRLVHDDDVFTVRRGVRSTQLKPGTIEKLVEQSKKKGLKLSETEIRYRIQCARAYPTDAKFAKILGEFDTWWDLIQAKFPEVESDPDEAETDYRTDEEKADERRRKLLGLAAMFDPQQPLPFPSDWEPDETPVKEMLAHTEDQDRITAGFVAAGDKRRAYLDPIVRKLEELGLDLETSWAEAHRLTYGEELEGTDFAESGDADGEF